VLATGALIWYLLPKGLQVKASDLRIQAVEECVFLDDIIVRAQAQALHSVILDSVESGRVEEVLIQDGTLVKKGQLLFRLSNPQRKGEHTQQISNLANMRFGFQMSITDHQRRLSALELSQTKKKHQRNLQLAAQGYISQVAHDESQDAVDRQTFAVNEEKKNMVLKG